MAKLYDQAFTQFDAGFGGLGYQAVGLGAALTGSETLQDMALNGQRGQEAIQSRLHLSGADTDVILRTTGQVANATPGLIASAYGGQLLGAGGAALLARTGAGRTFGNFLAGINQAKTLGPTPCAEPSCSRRKCMTTAVSLAPHSSPT